MLDRSTYIEAVRLGSPLLLEAARRDPKAPVPTCPGWSAATLLAHIGEVDRYWTWVIERRAQEQPAEYPREIYNGFGDVYAWFREGDAHDLEAIPVTLPAWFEEGATKLLMALEGLDSAEPIWHWSGYNVGLTHHRNMAMETTMHRWDAENATGTPTAVDPEIACDGIDQHLEVQAPAARRWGKPVAGSGETYHFHRTDGPGEWLVRFDGDRIEVRREHAKGDVAVRGTAEDLFLWLWGRTPPDRLEVFGDASLVERYHRLVAWD